MTTRIIATKPGQSSAIARSAESEAPAGGAPVPPGLKRAADVRRAVLQSAGELAQVDLVARKHPHHQAIVARVQRMFKEYLRVHGFTLMTQLFNGTRPFAIKAEHVLFTGELLQGIVDPKNLSEAQRADLVALLKGLGSSLSDERLRVTVATDSIDGWGDAVPYSFTLHVETRAAHPTLLAAEELRGPQALEAAVMRRDNPIFQRTYDHLAYLLNSEADLAVARVKAHLSTAEDPESQAAHLTELKVVLRSMSPLAVNDGEDALLDVAAANLCFLDAARQAGYRVAKHTIEPLPGHGPAHFCVALELVIPVKAGS